MSPAERMERISRFALRVRASECLPEMRSMRSAPGHSPAPGCPHHWHNMLAHVAGVAGTRAGVAAAVGTVAMNVAAMQVMCPYKSCQATPTSTPTQ